MPVKAIADAIGANTGWDAENKLVHISYNGKDAYISCIEEKPIPKPVQNTPAKQQTNASATNSKAYILNTNTMKIHSPYCRAVSTIHPENKQEYSGSIDDLKAKGYTPCGICHAN